MAEGTLILNAAKNIKNSVSGEELEEITKITLSQICDTLLSISGPYAKHDFIMGNAMQKSALSNAVSVGNMNVKTFTKDGRNILAQMDYASPIQKYIKDDIVSHIGQCIDNKCGDGTTTSMIFAASFVANMMKYKEYFSRISTAKLENLYKEITDDILNELSKFTITAEDENVEPWHIAYLQAHTSSGGMKNIAKAVSDVIKSTPRELWEYAIVQKYPKGESESDELVKVTQENCQYGIPVVLYNPDYLFRDIENKYECKDANILVAPYGLINSDPLFNKLKDYIENKQDKPLMVIVPSVCSNNLEEVICLAEKSKKEVLVFGHVEKVLKKGTNDWVLCALPIKANKVLPAPEIAGDIDLERDVLISGSVYTDGKYLKIDNILPKGDSNLHPVFEGNGNYKNTSEYLPLLYKLLENELALPEKNTFLIRDLKNALSIITSIYNITLEVNGTALDQQLISLVLDDATKASQISLLNGMVFNGPYRLYQATFMSSLNSLKKNDKETISTLCSILMYKCIMQAAVDMTQSVYGGYSKQMQFTVPQFLDKYNISDKLGYYTVNDEFPAKTSNSTFNIGETLNIDSSFNFEAYEPKYELDSTITVCTGDIFKLFKETDIDDIDHSKLPPCQPASLYKELFNRVRESGLRFAMAGELIVPGTVWDSKLNKKGE